MRRNVKNVSVEVQRLKERWEKRVLCWVGGHRDRFTENGGVCEWKTEGWMCHGSSSTVFRGAGQLEVGGSCHWVRACVKPQKTKQRSLDVE